MVISTSEMVTSQALLITENKFEMKKLQSKFILFILLTFASQYGFAQDTPKKYLDIDKSLLIEKPQILIAPTDFTKHIKKNKSGIYSPDGGATLYYVRFIENKMYWYSESESQAHVYSAELIETTTNSYRGKWYDLPNRMSNQKGSAIFALDSEGNIRKSSGNAHHEVLYKISRSDARIYYPPSNVIQNAWKVSSTTSLTGCWKATDGSNTYILQDGDDLIWFSEMTHKHETDPHQNFWSNVFIGTIYDRRPNTSNPRPKHTIAGTFIDVPKGTYSGSGELRVDFHNLSSPILEKWESPAYGTSKWYRQRQADLKMTLGQLVAISEDSCDEMDWKGNLDLGMVGNWETKNVAFETNRGIPNWGSLEKRLTLSFLYHEKLHVATVRFYDEDDALCGGGNDIIDISPCSSETTLKVYMDYFGNLYTDCDESFARAGDILTRITGDGKPKKSNLETGEITLTIKDKWVR